VPAGRLRERPGRRGRAARGVLALVIGLAGCRAAPRAPFLDTTPLALAAPFRMTLEGPDAPVVLVDVDGHEGLPFLLDSGSETTLIDARRARALGLPEKPARRVEISSGSGRASVVRAHTTIHEARLGALTLREFEVQLLDDPAFRTVGVFGILGQDLLARLPWVLDLEHRAVHFLPATTDVREYLAAQALGTDRWVLVDVDLRPLPFLELPVAGLRKGKVELLIDTGAGLTSFPRAAVEELGLPHVGTTFFMAVGGPRSEEIHAFASLALFGLTLDADVHACEATRGLLGSDLLRRFVVVFDEPRSRVWFHPSADAEVERAPRGSGHGATQAAGAPPSSGRRNVPRHASLAE